MPEIRGVIGHQDKSIFQKLGRLPPENPVFEKWRSALLAGGLSPPSLHISKFSKTWTKTEE
ncbi:hypothetical protein [Mongoliibacter ruber]|uniref:hypothetical protein n=1 Tax=Mongoliibacter ruber TaxID=1750599 RepID=UPI000D0804B9|nr:hypothetical protein [Mongoliibacter ruber]